ncbi:MAG TPA: hypothetical protein VFA18_04885 [Gemmataceae bacterium]|nr:hypothetical protein [Gemmataceae bacterium]
MFSKRSRREVLGLFFGAGLLGAWRALFGATVPPIRARAPVPSTAVPPITACPTGELMSVTTYVYDARGRMCMESACRNPPVVRTFTYKTEAPRTDPTQPPPRADDQTGGNAQG